jgi:MFS family permease
LLLAGKLQVWEIYIVIAIKSAITAFQWPAYSAATTLLVPKKHLARASGMVQVADAVAQIGSPLIAGALMGAVHIYGVMLIDFSTFLFALLTLLITRFPKPEISAESKAVQGSLLREAAFGWTYIVARPGLLGLLIYFAATNFCSGFIEVLFTPMVLNFSSPAVLGMILSIGGIGFLGGSLTMSIWGGPRRRIYGILGFSLIQGAVLFMAGFPPSVAILAAAAFFFFFSVPIINGCSQAIWQSKTAPDVQGRVFATRRMIAWSSLPLAYLFAGPLADRVFEPLLVEGGLLSSSVGRVIGVGPGRGIGLLFILFGMLILLTTGAGFSYSRLRRVETELPDVIEDKVPVPAAE